MRKSVTEYASYGFVNGFGVSGDPRKKKRLVKRIRRKLETGDWSTVLEFGAAYLAGAIVGQQSRLALGRLVSPRDEAGRW